MPPLSIAPGWWRLLALLLPPLAAAGLLAGALITHSSPVAPDPVVGGPVAAVAVPPAAGLLVYVSGAVARPGIVRVQRGERVFAAIEAAGGLVAGADAARLPDMAQRLRDGQQVKVPYRKGLGPAGSGTTTVRVSLNQATYEELLTVPGFSADLARAAVDYRSNYGGFSTTRELVTVLGMDAAGYATAKPYIKV